MVEATSTTNGELIVTRTNINPENVISSTTECDTTKLIGMKAQSSSIIPGKSPTEAGEMLDLSVEVLTISDQKDEASSVSLRPIP